MCILVIYLIYIPIVIYTYVIDTSSVLICVYHLGWLPKARQRLLPLLRLLLRRLGSQLGLRPTKWWAFSGHGGFNGKTMGKP